MTQSEQNPRVTIVRAISISLMALSIVLIGLAGATLAYAQWQDWQHEQRLDAALEEDDVGPMFTREASPPEEPNVPVDGTLSAATTPAIVEDPTPVPASSTASQMEPKAPAYGAPISIRIPRIRVNAPVMPVEAHSGAYEVPAWDVGFHADSAPPGTAGNSVFTGHVESINAGRVFARLGELEAGDRVTIVTTTHRTEWEILDSVAVPREENGYIYPSGDTRITLYTCAGRWDPLLHDYSHRRVVTGRLIQAELQGE